MVQLLKVRASVPIDTSAVQRIRRSVRIWHAEQRCIGTLARSVDAQAPLRRATPPLRKLSRLLVPLIRQVGIAPSKSGRAQPCALC